MKMSWRLWIRLWRMKRYSLENVEATVKRKGFSRTALSNLGESTEAADPDLVGLAWKQETLGPTEDFEIFWRGLATMGVEVPAELLAKLGTPPPSRVDPVEIAEGLMPKLDAVLSSMGDQLNATLATAHAKVDAMTAFLRGKLEAFTLATRGTLDNLDGKLDVVQATLNHADAKIDLLDMKADASEAQHRKDKRAIQRTTWLSGALVGGFVAVGFVAVLDRLVLAHALRVASATPPVTIVVGSGADGAVVTSDSESWFNRKEENVGGKEVGEKTPREQHVPVKPFPGQATPPCMEDAGEVTINGGCYVTTKVKPPCGRYLYRSGDECYRPIKADAREPSTAVP
jgi:hypothetical protein